MRPVVLPLLLLFPIASPGEPIDLRPQFEQYGLVPRSQGPRPTCSIFTTVAAFEFAYAKVTGRGERLSAEYLNWAANAANGRHDDGDFFHFALSGYARFGICGEDKQPYAREFADAVPPPDALVDAGKHLAGTGSRIAVRWIRPIGGGPGLDDAQFADLVQTLAKGWPVAAGAAHSRLLVGYREDAGAAGGGVFLTLDSALARFAEVTAEFVKTKVCDAFAVEVVGK
ncbi:MAG: hypothetical protein U1E73_08870 [Planctomycetota bacterium]